MKPRLSCNSTKVRLVEFITWPMADFARGASIAGWMHARMVHVSRQLKPIRFLTMWRARVLKGTSSRVMTSYFGASPVMGAVKVQQVLPHARRSVRCNPCSDNRLQISWTCFLYCCISRMPLRRQRIAARSVRPVGISPSASLRSARTPPCACRHRANQESAPHGIRTRRGGVPSRLSCVCEWISTLQRTNFASLQL